MSKPAARQDNLPPLRGNHSQDAHQPITEPLTPLQLATDYLGRGWSPVPIPPGRKGPLLGGWQKLKVTRATVAGYFEATEGAGNVGVLLGEPSGWLADVDMDCQEVQQLAAWLPATGARFGRASTPHSHSLYQLDGELKRSIKYIDPLRPKKEATLMELRVTGQTVFPGSIHPSGERVAWCNGGVGAPHLDAPHRITPTALQASCARVAAAALLVRYWPEGGRHELVLGLAGGLLTCGTAGVWSPERVERLVAGVCRLTGDEEATDRLRAVKDTAARISRGERAVAAWGAVEGILGREVTERVSGWLDARPAAGGGAREDVTEMFDGLQESDGVDNGGFIETAQVDKELPRYVYLRALDRFYEARTSAMYPRAQMDAMHPPTDPKIQTRFCEAFFRDEVVPGMNSFDCVTYRPGEGIAVPSAGGKGSELNLWRPGEIERELRAGDEGDVAGLTADPATVKPWLWLLERLVPDSTERLHLLCWMTYTVQRPGEKINHCVLMVGPTPGQGKDTLIAPLKMALGARNCIDIFADTLMGNFNTFLKNRKLVVVQEIMDFIDKGRVSNYLKPMLASPPEMIEIREKYMSSYELPNLSAWWFMSNEEAAMRIGRGDRRYFCVRVDAPALGEYSGRLWRWYQEEGGWLAVARYLMAFDWVACGFDPKATPPDTAFKQELIAASRSEAEMVVADVIDREPAAWRAFTLESLRLAVGTQWTVKRLSVALRRLGYLHGQRKVGGIRHRFWYSPELDRGEAEGADLLGL